ncbi:MAG: aminoacyl-tRNA hydrolase [Candidatus Makaraimicrobium thalassicum]|nr:MAG: aminoacyl-tRNA hydrolase [Candidatus Omnitrophota bacterium]
MKIIVGLGNPGLKYRNTRHNAGFLALGALAKKYRIAIKKRGFSGIYGIGRILQQEVVLFEPLTYMNLSGEAVKAVCSFGQGEGLRGKKRSKKDLLVISDDFNLALGRIRLRQKGSSGGHNGLQSTIEKMGPDFFRLRVGVGPAGPGGFEEDRHLMDMSAYVLSPFLRGERGVLNEALGKAVGCIETWLTAGIKEAMNRYNK